MNVWPYDKLLILLIWWKSFFYYDFGWWLKNSNEFIKMFKTKQKNDKNSNGSKMVLQSEKVDI